MFSTSSSSGWPLILLCLCLAGVRTTTGARGPDSEQDLERRPEIAETAIGDLLHRNDEPTIAPAAPLASTQVNPALGEAEQETPGPESAPTPTPTPTAPSEDQTSTAGAGQHSTGAPSTDTAGSEASTTATLEYECELECLNNGVCRVMPDGSEKCFCPEAFWGARCQLRNICKSIIADNMTGDDICKRIGSHCIIDDKLFRCKCKLNEFFIFKADYSAQKEAQSRDRPESHSPHPGSSGAINPQEMSSFVYDAVLASVSKQQAASSATASAADFTRLSYLAECRQVDKCIGVRCRQRSEVCVEGRCRCNQNLGFIRDPRDNLCKLLNPCNMPRSGPICGEAKCLPTYDRNLYKCVCPVGYYAVAPNADSSSIKCALLQYQGTSSVICLVPLLNKCQHVCEIHNESYRCACFAGYRPGRRPGIDDHLCFFEDYIGEREIGDEIGLAADQGSPGLSFEPIHWETTDQQLEAPPPKPGARSAEQPPTRPHQAEPPPIRRIRRTAQPSYAHQTHQAAVRTGFRLAGGGRADSRKEQNISPGQASFGEQLRDTDPDDNEDSGKPTTAQELCNMYCDENKICVLEDKATGIYRCVCDRQGYVSVGDKCLDWCSAAEFSHSVRFLLDLTCATGLCKRRPSDKRPPANQAASYYSKASFLNELSREQQQLVRTVARSSWRPQFQCDCSTSPLVYEDPSTRLCQLNFSAILEPCLPGNEGHTDCVENKHAYCAVLHKDPLLHNRGLTSGQLMEQMINQAKSSESGGNQKFQHQPAKASPSAATSGSEGPAAGPKGSAAAKKAKPPREKPYVCVCSPEKKFLVDKPRKKARCIDECDLLSNECGRFNRMCRAATISSNDRFGDSKSTLVREDQDGIRMNQFKRTGCECLPGFNVGPSEPRDFTLDSNYPTGEAGDDENHVADDLANGTSGGAACSLGCNSVHSHRPLRFGWDLLESLLLDANVPSNKSPPKVDPSILQNEFVAVGQDIEHLRTRYMNINSRCLLDYDVVDFHARFKAPADFEPSWVDWAHQRRPADEDEAKSQSASGAGSTPARKPTNPLESDSKRLPRSNESLHSLNNDPVDRPAGRQALLGMSQVLSDGSNEDQLRVPDFMRADMADFYKHVVLVADCNFLLSQKSFGAYVKCIRYRYWIVQKLRAHFADWRQVISSKLRETFDLMDGNIRFRVNKCESILKRARSLPRAYSQSLARSAWEPFGGARQAERDRVVVVQEEEEVELGPEELDPWDHFARVDADLDCKLTIHSASEYDSLGARKHPKPVLLEKQLPKFIFDLDDLNIGPLIDNTRPPADRGPSPAQPADKEPSPAQPAYYIMAPNTLIHHESYDKLAVHWKPFSPCNSEYSYCDKQTKCMMQDKVNYSCTCETGYTPIGSRDIYFQDSRKEVCEDINECLFDVCKGNGLEDKSVCVNEIGDYKCQCIRHHVGDNKRFCNHICNVIACKHGDCRIPDEHHAFCECYEGYRDADCSVQDPSVALRKANMIICGSIFASVLLLTITLAISLNSQLKKTKKKLKRLEAAQEAADFYEFSIQQPPYRHRVSKASITS